MRDDLQQMSTSVADVAELGDEIVSELDLGAEVELMDVRRLKFGIDEYARYRDTDERNAGRQRRRNGRGGRECGRERQRNERIRRTAEAEQRGQGRYSRRRRRVRNTDS